MRGSIPSHVWSSAFRRLGVWSSAFKRLGHEGLLGRSKEIGFITTADQRYENARVDRRKSMDQDHEKIEETQAQIQATQAKEMHMEHETLLGAAKKPHRPASVAPEVWRPSKR